MQNRNYVNQKNEKILIKVYVNLTKKGLIFQKT